MKENITIDDFEYEKDFSVVVDLNQDQHTLIRGLFDLATEFEDSKFYDVSTWTLPLAYGMNFNAIENNNQKEKLLGDIYDNRKPLISAPEKPEYAYAFEWSDYYSPKALYNILDKGLLARVAMNPFIGSTKKGSHDFDRGTIVVSFDRQDASENDIHNIMKDIAQDDGIFIHSLTSGKSVTGTENPDLGSQFIKAIHKPTILLVAGREMDWYNVGEIWHLLDVRMNIPVTLIDRLQMNNIDLNRYTHIIYAGGQYSNYQPKYPVSYTHLTLPTILLV